MHQQRLAPHELQDLRRRNVLSDVIGRDVKLLRKGQEWVGLCPFHTEKTGSFTVNDGKEFYHCFGCGAHGDVIRYVMTKRSRTFLEAVADLGGPDLLTPGQKREFDKEAERARQRELEAERKARDEKAEQNRLDRQRGAHDHWRSGRRLEGTIGSQYLAETRGISQPHPWSVLRWRAEMWREESQDHRPAIIAAMQGADDRFSALHITYLVRSGTARWEKLKPTIIRGVKAGAAIRLTAIPGDVRGLTLYLAEGVETSLSVLQALNRAGLDRKALVWAAGDLWNLAAVQIPKRNGRLVADQVVLCMDHDQDTARKFEIAKQCEARAAMNYAAQGVGLRVAYAAPGRDFNDMVLGKAGKGANG